MNEKLQNKLYEKYPLFFKQKDLPMNQTCMCWGINCGDGWYRLLDTTLNYINRYINNNRHNINVYPVFTQVKEKYGTLRIYTGWDKFDDDKPEPEQESCKRMQQEIEGVLSFTEYLSGFICEECGDRGINLTIHGWCYTLCKKHIKEYKQNRKHLKRSIFYTLKWKFLGLFR